MLKKVCGINDLETYFELENIEEVNLLGFIFYDKSPRNVNIVLPMTKMKSRVGVFVNPELEFMHEMKEKFNLDYAQLHGDESPELCVKVRSILPVIKAFGIDDNFDFKRLEAYENCVDTFLFDTKSVNYGGTGSKFSWNVLDKYHSNVPFLLSGGISQEDAEEINKIKITQFSGIDINSKFEISPGVKDVQTIKTFLKQLK